MRRAILAAALTATEWKDRILGRTEVVTVPLRTTWLATGNNLTFKRTLGRRVIPIDLDSKEKLLSMPMGIPFVSSSRKLSLPVSKTVRGFIAAFA